ncbi:MAG: Flp pilus assembly complex ATPase component TadA [Betaproteobacteria bacterium]|nr:Flp pilus assembly complex ATPase component TadA [Betaproteobacteria bacterium]
MARPEKVRLGEILVQQKLLTQEQLKLALDEQKRSGRKLGRVFIEQGYVTEEEISEALAKQLQIPYINLKYYNIRPEVTQKLPETQARRFRAIALEDNARVVKIGMADPTDLNAYDEIARILKREIEIAVVTESQLLATVDRVYRRTGEITGLAQELQAELGDAVVDFGVLAITPGLEEAPVVKLLQSVFEDATQVRASDIHIEPQEKKLIIRFRIDGVLHLQTEADPKIASALVLRLKLMSGLDISEKRLPQDGRFNVKIRNSMVDVRISSMPTQFGESVVMRLLNQASGILTLDKLGMPPHILERVHAVLRRPSGMMLVTGPTGSGKTTTLYAALAELNTPERKIITVEDPVEYRLPGINQVQVHEKIELTFGRVLRSALRQDPDVILVGEMRDQETVETGLRAAMTGHMVLSTLHTNDAVTTPVRLLDMGAPRYMVALSLQMVLAQRLVRLICESCSETYTLLPGEHEWLSQELGSKVDNHRYVKGKGCSHCNGTGYLGRTGVYEMLEMSKPVVEAANQEDPAAFIEVASREMGGRTLRAHAAQLVIDSKTTVDEAMRISNQFEDS